MVLSSYMRRMPRFTHPRLEDVPLDLALHALADPNRLAMVARLAATERLSCTGAAPCEMINTLRRSDFDRRFPGLLDVVLANRIA
jgi:hypothetical protein